MTDIEKFIRERRARNPGAWAGFAEDYRRYAIGMLLAEHRAKAGLSLAELAKRIKMQKTALSRLENHGEDVRLSTIARYVEATGRPLTFRISPTGRKRRPGQKFAAALELQSA